MAKLIFSGEHFAGRVYELTLQKTTVGRGPLNTLALQDPSVSLAHCEILVHGPEVIVRDLGSANGTFVNGVRLDDQQCQIKSDQTVRFGSVEARLDLGLPNWDDTASEETAVFAMRRSQRDKRREEKKPRPASASATFESSSLPVDQTVLLQRDSPPVRAAPPPSPQQPESAPGRSPSRTGVWITLALILGLAILLWLIWRRR